MIFIESVSEASKWKSLYKTSASTTGVACSMASPNLFLCALATTLIMCVGPVWCSLYRANGCIVQVHEAGYGQTCSLTWPSRLSVHNWADSTITCALAQTKGLRSTYITLWHIFVVENPVWFKLLQKTRQQKHLYFVPSIELTTFALDVFFFDPWCLPINPTFQYQ